MNTIRFRLRTLDLFLATFVIALVIVSAKEGRFFDTIYSHILLLVLAGMLGAVTSRIVSDKFRLGTVCGLLLGVLGYLLAVFLIALGIRLADRTVVSICVCTGGIVGGLIPTVLHRFSKASRRIQIGILLVGIALLAIPLSRGWVISEQYRIDRKLRAAGAIMDYWDVNIAPEIFNSQKMIDSKDVHPYSLWLRELLGVRIITNVRLPSYPTVNHLEVFQILVDEMPEIESVCLYADYADDRFLELLNSGKLPRLSDLGIWGQAFDDESLSRFDPLPSLIYLHLRQTSITDKSIEQLLGISRLQVLDVRQTNISDEGAKRLKSKITIVGSDY